MLHSVHITGMESLLGLKISMLVSKAKPKIRHEDPIIILKPFETFKD
jgi:hypothetical protein